MNDELDARLKTFVAEQTRTSPEKLTSDTRGVAKMKERTGRTSALVSLLITCVLIGVGCQPRSAYITVDARSTLMQPTFCFYRDASLQERLDIESIMVWKVQRSAISTSQWEQIQKVWHLYYIENQSTSPVLCLTYGEVPPSYTEDVKALPLKPEQFYKVMAWSDRGIQSEELYFIIRLDGTGTPQRLESH